MCCVGCDAMCLVFLLRFLTFNAFCLCCFGSVLCPCCVAFVVLCYALFCCFATVCVVLYYAVIYCVVCAVLCCCVPCFVTCTR